MRTRQLIIAFIRVMGQNFNVVFEAGLGYMGPCRKNNGRMKKPVLEIPVWNALYKKVREGRIEENSSPSSRQEPARESMSF